MGAKHPARNPAKCLASCPRNFPAMAGQWQQQCRRMSVKTTRKITYLAPDLDAQQPRSGQCNILQAARGNPAVMFLTIPFKNYEHLTHITDNARSGIAEESDSGIPTRSKSHSIQQFESVS
jgi:hypothetical protein